MTSSLVYGSPAIGYVQPAANQSLVTENWTDVGDIVTVYTVPAGKTLFIAGAYIYSHNVGLCQCALQLDAISDILRVTQWILAAGTAVLIAPQVISNGICPIAKVPAGTNITVVTSVGNHNYGMFWGWLQ